MSRTDFSVNIRTQERSLASIEQFSVHQDRVTFLFGESGIGKSIINKAIYGLLDPAQLDVTVNDREYGGYRATDWVQRVRKSSFFVFQEPSTHLNTQQTIREQLREGSLVRNKTEADILATLWRNHDTAALERIMDVFPKPYRPSGGEKQRFLLAMAFKKLDLYVHSPLEQPTFFCFDEPTGSLDNAYRNLFLKMLLDRYRERHFTCMIITHDYSIISELQQNHADLKDKIKYMELSRELNTRLRLQEFRPDTYTAWLADTAPVPPAAAGSAEVLRVKPHFSIFGRDLVITKDGTEPADMVVRKGDLMYLKAASGVGKTTLAKIVMGLYKADAIDITLAGLDFTEKTPEQVWHRKIWGKKAGMVFQHADESLNLASTVKEVFDGLPLKDKLTQKDLIESLSWLLTQPVGPDFLKKKVATLSGGQKQCLNLLRTFISNPDLIVMDEPLNGLDFNRVRQVLTLIRKACASGTAIFIITHNEEIMEHLIHPTMVWRLVEKKG